MHTYTTFVNYMRMQIAEIRRFRVEESARQGRWLSEDEAIELWIDQGLSGLFREHYERGDYERQVR